MDRTEPLPKAVGPFDPPSLAAWSERIISEAGRPDAVQRLARRTEDGRTIKPLYTAADLHGLSDVGAPGAWPFVRGSQAERHPARAWTIAVTADDGPLTEVRRTLDEEILGGATGVWGALHRGVLAAHPELGTGLALHALSDFELVFQNALPAGLTVFLDAGRAAPEALLLLLAVGQRAGVEPGSLRLHGLYDPLAGSSLDATLRRQILLDLVTLQREELPAARPLVAASLPWHHAGATVAEELALATLAFIELLRDGLATGFDARTIAQATILRLELGRDFYESIAALRALRALWSRVLARFDLPEIPAPYIHATTSLRTMARRDPDVNLLRGTCQALAAALGGADAISVRPHDEVLGRPSSTARRTARNLQHLLMLEAGLGGVIDPCGGSYFLERTTAELAEAAFSIVREIEARGGLYADLRRGAVHARVQASAQRRQERIAQRKLPILGVSEFAAKDPVPARPMRSHAVQRSATPATTESALAARAKALAHGEPMAAVLAAARSAEGPTLPPLQRDASSFEALRDRADAVLARGTPPRALLVTLGTEKEHRARRDFALAALEVGGFAARTAPAADHPCPEEPVVIICGSEEAYAAGLAAEVQRLRERGHRAIWLAGPPREGAAVDGCLFLGGDLVQTLHAWLLECER